MNCARRVPLLLPFAGALLCILGASFCAAAEVPKPVSFELDVMPILTAGGCNQGACHGKARGQNGFQLSLLGFDPDFDFAALTKQSRGRRIFPLAPDQSLLLQKATGRLPHGGGIRLQTGSDEYVLLRRWIELGAQRAIEGEPKLQRVTVSRTELFMKPGQKQPLQITAHYSDGSQRNVTRQTQFQSSEAAIVAATKQGEVVAGPIPGEATIMSRYMNLIGTTHVAVPLPGQVSPDFYAKLPRRNFIDDLVWKKLQSLGITPSPPCDDAKFLRRVHLDLIGRIPTPEEARGFLQDQSPDKRARLIDALLERPEYADHWATKWADLLRPNPYRVGIKNVISYDQWIRNQFRKNRPYDQFVHDLITAKGSTWENGATVLFRDRREPAEMTTLVSQLFLGIRLECAKCHHHPFEKWGQDDFYSLAAYFARTSFDGVGLSPPISGGEELIVTAASGQVTHPLTGAALPARPLFGEALKLSPDDDPREALAQWITSEKNPYFARVIVNRVWADLMGRGIVDPVDDLRATNPPTNPELLEELAKDFRTQGCDLKKLLKRICSSEVYALGSLPTERNKSDRQNYSRHYRSRLRAEVVLDAVLDVTGGDEARSAMPAESHANQIWSTRVSSVFLDTFGRPNPNQDPPCERTPEATVTQALHLMNSPDLQNHVTSDKGRAAQLADSSLTNDQVIEELYLLVYGRFPDNDERKIGRDLFTTHGMSRRRAAQDLMWALLNTPEFLFKD